MSWWAYKSKIWVTHVIIKFKSNKSVNNLGSIAGINTIGDTGYPYETDDHWDVLIALPVSKLNTRHLM